MNHLFLLCVDARFPGGTSSAIINELRALASRFSPEDVGVLCVEAGFLPTDAPPNKALERELARTPFAVYKATPTGQIVAPLRTSGFGLPVTQTIRSRYLIVHNPLIAASLATLKDVVTAEQAIIVGHQPYTDSAGVPYYSGASAIRALESLCQSVRFAPIGVISRESFIASGWPAARLTAFDWPNVLDFEKAHLAPASQRFSTPGPLTIGRHSRPDWVKWPADADEFRLIYQHGSERLARFLGWGAHCDAMFRDCIPRNWRIKAFNEVDPDTFLADIDLFVYYHHPNWVEGFGRNVLESLAAGIPCVLPPNFGKSFGGTALLAEPHEVPALLKRLDDRRDALAEWSSFVVDIGRRVFGSERIQEIYRTLAETSDAAEADASLLGAQHTTKEILNEAFERQRALKLVPDRISPMKPTINRVDQKVAKGVGAKVVDYAIYMDLRSARSDLWRTIELAEALHNEGYEVCVVHVESGGKMDLPEPGPIMAELSDQIEILEMPFSRTPDFLHIREALIVCGPQRLLGPDGNALFDTWLRAFAPSVVVLLDKAQPPQWYKAAERTLALVTGKAPVWAPIGPGHDTIHQSVHGAVVPDLFAFVADRHAIAARDIMASVRGQRPLRLGRIGLMDASQWVAEGDEIAEVTGQNPLFLYAVPNSRLAPEAVRTRASTYEFRSSDISLSRFLEKVDVVTYFPTERPSDLALIPLLRAAQAGVLVIADGSLKQHLGEAALYCRVHEVRALIESLNRNPERAVTTGLAKARSLSLAGTARKAVTALRTLHSSGLGSAAQVNSRRSRTSEPAEVLFVSSNGIGLGHLTRLLAIARRLERAAPVFATMSQAFGIVKQAGIPVHFIPFHGVAGCNVEHWNEWFRFELETILANRPNVRTLVFDGSNPYSGLMAAAAGTNLRKVWVQRGMWKKGHLTDEHERRGKNFDLIIEPADLAASLCEQPVESDAFDKVETNPITLLDEHELLGREEARRELGIPVTERACLIQLGSGTNRDIVSLLSEIMPALLRRGIKPYIAEWLMGSEIPRVWPEAGYLRVFPLSRYYRAFDFSISAAGYNSYHEIIAYQLPTIFIANQHQMMDDQAARAKFAMQNDAAMWIVEEAIPEIDSVIDLMARSEVRELIASNCAALRIPNGARQAAAIIDLISAPAEPNTAVSTLITQSNVAA